MTIVAGVQRAYFEGVAEKQKCNGGRHRWPEHTSLWGVYPAAEAGTVEAYGVPDFPRFFTAQWVRDEDCRTGETFSLAMNIHTPDAAGSAVTGVFAAPAPGQSMDTELPDLLSLIPLVDVLECLRQAVYSAAAGPIDGRTAVASREGLLAALGQIERGALAREQAKKRRWRHRDRALMQEAATVFLNAQAEGRPKYKALEAHFSISTKTAEDYVRTARRMGLLKPHDQ